ncbi:MAG TPA: tryptophan--tRNA ligase, partial [Rhodanobacteraceae bacterium]
HAVGLGPLAAPARKTRTAKKAGKRPRIVSFRDGSGFRFRLLAADGEELLLSRAFVDPRGAGEASRALGADDAATLLVADGERQFALRQGDDVIALSNAFADTAARDAALERARATLIALHEAG